MLNDSDAVNRTIANGVTTVFPYTWKIYDKSEIEVLSGNTALTVDVDFTVDGIGVDGGGNVTISSAPSNGTIITRLRKQPTTQASNYQSETFPPERIEKDFDKLAMRLQQVKEQLRRCWSFVKSSSTVDQTVDTPTEGLFARAKVGGGIDWATPTLASPASLPISIANGGTGATNAAGARVNLLISPMPISEGGTGAATAGGARTNLDVSATEPAENVFKVQKSGDPTTKLAFSLGSITPATTRTLTVQDQNGTVALLSNLDVNPIINSSMEIWQRGTSFASVVTGAYMADRWKWQFVGSGVVDGARSTNVPTVGQAGVLFNYSLQIDVTTADAAIAAADFYAVRHAIEGYNWRQYAQRNLVVSFWVMSPKTGTHCVALINSGSDRSITATYSVSVADTWEYKSVLFTASPAAGTWDYTTGVGTVLSFVLAAGSNFHTTADVWQTGGPYLSTSAQVNCLDSTANFFRLTGVKMELGSAAMPLVYAPFETELVRCQRYYQKSFLYATAPAQNVGVGSGELRCLASAAGAVSQFSHTHSYRTQLRTTVTPTLYNPAAANAQIRNITDSADLSASSIQNATDTGFSVTATGTAGTVIGEVLGVHWTADAEL